MELENLKRNAAIILAGMLSNVNTGNARGAVQAAVNFARQIDIACEETGIAAVGMARPNVETGKS